MCPNKTSWMESSNAAIRALNLMLVQGKDDIYFYFDGDEKECEYFMIPALDVQLSRAVTNLPLGKPTRLGLVRKTKAWRNSIVREQMDDGFMKDLIDGLADEN